MVRSSPQTHNPGPPDAGPDPVDTAAREVVGHFLAMYREDREVWPFWTYERRPGLGWGSPDGALTPWADRLGWSANRALFSIWWELERSAIRLGWSTTFHPHTRQIVVFKVEDRKTPRPRIRFREDSPVPPTSIRSYLPGHAWVPPGAWARTLAVSCVTASPEPPDNAAGIEPIEGWARHGFLDADDVREIQRRLVSGLFFSMVGEDGQKLFLHFLSAVRAPEGGDKGEALLGLLGEALGLTLGYRQGGGSRVPDAVLAQLQREAIPIVEAVRAYEPDADVLTAVDELLLSHDAIPAHQRALVIERRRRRMDASDRAGHLVTMLRFPFLRPAELRYITHGGKSPRATAETLTISRLARDMDPKTLNRRTKKVAR